jgi:hypothetical protein
MSKVEFRRSAGGRLAKSQQFALFFKRMVFRIRKQGLVERSLNAKSARIAKIAKI